jgi:hypothetical protein
MKTLLVALFVLVSGMVVFADPVITVFYVDDGYDEQTEGWGVTHFDSINDAIDATTSNNFAIWVKMLILMEEILPSKRRIHHKPPSSMAVKMRLALILQMGKIMMPT